MIDALAPVAPEQIPARLLAGALTLVPGVLASYNEFGPTTTRVTSEHLSQPRRQRPSAGHHDCVRWRLRRIAAILHRVRIEQTFEVASSPEAVFDYMTDPANLRDWQTSKTRVEVLSEGEPRQGYRVREWTKVPGRKEFEQVVEFAQFERPRRLHTHIVEGPQPIDGRWALSATEHGTRVTFTAEGPLQGPMRLLAPVVTWMIDRQFREYHDNLRRNVEATTA